MLTHQVHTRFGDSDQLQHMHHLTYAEWFEEARNPIFQWFNPKFDLNTWNLILVHIELDYLGQVHFSDQDIEIRSWISHIGNSSFTVAQAAYKKDGSCAATGKCVLLYFDFEKQKGVTVPPELRKKLEEHYDPDAPHKQA